MQAPSPAASPPAPTRPPRPCALESRLPAPSPQQAARGAGTPRGQQALRWWEGEAGCSTAGLSAGEELQLPFVSKSKHCPLLSRPRQRARHTVSQTACSSRVLRIFREGAGRAEPPLGKFPRQLCTQGTPGGPEGARLAAEAANAPSTTPELPKMTGSLEIRGPHSLRRTLWVRRAAGSRLLPAEAATTTAPPWGRARGTFPAWSPAKETRSRAEGAVGAEGPRSGWKETRGASCSWTGEKGRARGKQERSDKSGDVLWTSEESRWRGPLVSHGEVSGMGNGGPAGEVGANGQPGEAGGPASYGDNSELGRVRKV